MSRGTKWFIISVFICNCAFSLEKNPYVEYIPVYYSADSVEVLFNTSGEVNRAKLNGNVKIMFEDIIIRCETAELRKETGEVIAEGNLYIETSKGNIKADRITYNFENKKGIMLNATFSSPPYFGKAKKIEKDGDTIYLIDGYITTCDLEKPHYRISAGRLKYVKDEYFLAERMKFVLGENFSIFYFPRYTVDIKTKEPAVSVSPGYTSKTGENLEVIFAQRTGEKSDAVMKERILIGKKGIGAGGGIKSEKEIYKGEALFYKEWEEGNVEPVLLFEFLKNYKSTYGEGAILFDWRYIDNSDIFYNFFRSDYIEKSKRYNYFSYTHNFPKGIFNLNFRESAEEEFLNIEKLPEIRFYTPAIRLGDTPVFLENNFNFTNFYKDDENYIRVMDILTLKGYGSTGYFRYSPYISLGGIEYSYDEEEKFNFYREAGIKLSTMLVKKYSTFTEYFIPYLTLLHREMDYEREQLEYFDKIEEMENGNFLDIGMDWFYKKEKGYLGRITLNNIYNIDNNQLNLCSLKYDISLASFLSIEGKNEWDISENRYLFGVNDIIFKGEKSSYSIGNRYDYESDTSGIEGKLTHIISEDWKYSTGIQYDFNSDDISRVSLNVWHKLHCWELNVGISGNKDDFSVFIMLQPFI